jgi:SAM-dependent methyltransferase
MRGMKNIQTQLVDRQALDAHRSRPRAESVTFVSDEVHAELHERLAGVNRTFKNVAIVGKGESLLAQHFPDAEFVSDEDTLEFDGSAYDLIIHDMCLHWSNDPVGQLVQCRLALKPDGLFLATLFGGQTLHELRSVLAEAEIEVSGGLSPRVAPMGEIRDLGALLQRAGFALPVADSFCLNASYENQYGLMKDLRGMAETNVLSQRIRHFTPRRLFDTSAKKYAESFPSENARIAATFEIVTLTGWAPDENQPKALRPGTATNRLAEALGTSETKLNSSGK